MAQTGTRNSGWVSPRDLTGTKARQLTAEKARREAAQNPDQNQLDAAYQRGRVFGEEVAERALKSALVNIYKAEGISAIEEWLQEEVQNASASDTEHD